MNELTMLEKAYNILYKRDTEKAKQYGDFHKSMAKAAKIATELTNKIITTEDMYRCLIALKLSRDSYKGSEDTMLDLVTYIASLNDLNKNKK